MSNHYDRAFLLYQQSRYDLAVQELRQEMAGDPNNPLAHALLALCLCGCKDYRAATAAAEEAVHLGPNLPFGYYALASSLYHADRLSEAEEAIGQALALDPWDANYHSLLASIRFDQRRWADALEAAERGLEQDPEHSTCVNVRAMALVKLGRRTEAGAAISDALRRDPDDALTHANQGWTLLEQSQPEKAMEHFREALRLEPNLEWAREGIVAALKARHWLYRQMLRYFLWMRRLSRRAQWGVIVGVLLTQQLLASDVLPPALAPLGKIFLWSLVVFVLLSWTADPLFNLLLRLNRFGRLTLSREQIWASNCVGGCLLAALLALGGWAVSDDFRYAWAALVSAWLIIPIAAAFKCSAGWPRLIMASYTVLLAAIGFGTIALAAVIEYLPPRVAGVALAALPPLLLVFMLGGPASTWLYNVLVLTRLRR